MVSRRKRPSNDFQSKFTLSLLLLFLLTLLWGGVDGGHDEEKKKPQVSGRSVEVLDTELIDTIEFAEFCELGLLERQVGLHIQDDVKVAECSVTFPGEFDMEVDGKMLFTLIAIIGWGAIVRAVIQHWELKIPYTVVLMLSGLIVGTLSRTFCNEMYEYTAIARISSSLILYTFLPLLIFESAFSIPVHTFQRSAVQIIIVAFPGMVFCTFFTSGVCLQYFKEYKWGFMGCNLFGSIISATDPVAVVAILRELGVSEVLSVMIEGESLLNDGVAILLYEIFEEILGDEAKGIIKPFGEVLGDSCIKFVRIAIGGPVFGWVMGKITIFLLSYVFNDAPVEISATIVSAYITYWISEDVLGVSGVMAVVLLGLTMRAERTVISPDSEESVHHFWSIMGYLANTVLFKLVGIVIAETAVKDIDLNDVWNLILLYVAIHVSRFVMLTLFYPILRLIGYGMTWQNMIVMMWGGLRGAVGICLALDVYRNEHFCENPLMGAKMLFQTAGIVLLTLCVNGTTTRPLLTALKLTEVSLGRKEDMKFAIIRIRGIKGQGIRTFQLSPRMFDANWKMVDDFCTVKNPYKIEKKHILAKQEKMKDTKEQDEKIEPPEPARENATICLTCQTIVPNEPTSEEYYNLTEEARLKVIRAMKVSYTHRNSIGLVLDNSLQILMGDAERKEDIPLQLICASDFDKYTKTRGCYPWLAEKISKIEKRETVKPPKPRAAWRSPFWKLICHQWFDTAFMLIVVLNLIPVLWEVIISLTEHSSCDEGQRKYKIFAIVNIVFTALFTVEFLLNVLGRTLKDYFSDYWTYLDLLVLILGYVDICLYYFRSCRNETGYVGIGKIFRLLRFSRALRLLRPTLPKFKSSIHKKIDHQIFVGFDIARGFVYASEEVHRFLPQMIENKRVLKEIKEHMEHERAEGLKAMARLQQQHPGIAFALKTRHACRMVINVMSDELTDAKDEGLLDATEVDVLIRILELQIKRLWNSPVSLDPFTSQVLLANLSWIEHSDELYDKIMDSAELTSYGYGDYICKVGEETSGVFVIVAGMIKVSYLPSPTLVDIRNNFGKIPNSEIYTDLTFSEAETDYFSAGFVFGEYGVLTADKWASDIVAETSLVVYHISKDVIKAAIQKYQGGYNPLEGQVWRSIAMRRATGLLEQRPEYQNALDQIPILLQRSTVVINDTLNVFDIAPYVSEVVIIEGFATNKDTNDTYIAPFVVPRTCSKLIRMPNSVTVNRILIVADGIVDLSTPNSNGRTSGEYRRNMNW